MSMTWFRLYHDMPNDRKLRKFSPQQKWAWVVLLCLASESKERGFVDIGDEEDLADYCGFESTQDFQYFLDKLRQKGMVEPFDSKIKITNWGERQYSKPSDKPEAVKARVARHRAKKKAEKEKAVTPCNALQTPMKHAETHRSDTDSDSDTDSEKKERAVESNFPKIKPPTMRQRMERFEKKELQPSSPWVEEKGFNQGFLAYLAKNQLSKYSGDEATIKACSMVSWAESQQATPAEKARMRSLWNLYRQREESTPQESGHIRKGSTATSTFWESAEAESFERHIAKCVKGDRFEFVEVLSITKQSITYKPNGRGRGVTETHSKYHSQEAIAS